MKKLSRVIAQFIFMAALFAVTSYAAIGENDEALKKDLAAVIALQGLPCMQVVTVKTQADNDYAVTCKDQNKYHIYLNAAGRVIVEKSK